MQDDQHSPAGADLIWHVAEALLPAGWARDVRISVSNGRISAIDAGQSPLPGDIRLGVGLPAMGNLHSHAFQRAMAGLTEIAGKEGDSFWSWRQLMYRFVDAITPDAMEMIAAYAFMEMIEAGFSRVGEFHYLHHDIDGSPYAAPAEMGSRLAAAAEQAGIGLTLLPVYYAQSGFGGQPPSPAQRRFICDPDSYARLIEESRAALRPLAEATVGLAPHSLRAVTPDDLARILTIDADGPVHIHIAEQVREVDDCLAWSGARPVQWLLDNNTVDARWCLVHATHVDDDEVSAMARSGAVAGLCPITEANLGDGLFPVRDFLRAGGHIGIGSDSNVRIDLTEELRLLEYGQRLQTRSRNVVGDEGRSTGRALFDHSMAGGVRALGVTHGLVVGAAADLIVLDRNGPATCGRTKDAIIDTLLFSAGQHAISEIWRAGRRLVVDGRHVHREAIEGRYHRTLKELLS